MDRGVKSRFTESINGPFVNSLGPKTIFIVECAASEPLKKQLGLSLGEIRSSGIENSGYLSNIGGWLEHFVPCQCILQSVHCRNAGWRLLKQ